MVRGGLGWRSGGSDLCGALVVAGLLVAAGGVGQNIGEGDGLLELGHLVELECGHVEANTDVAVAGLAVLGTGAEALGEVGRVGKLTVHPTQGVEQGGEGDGDVLGVLGEVTAHNQHWLA